MAIGWVGRDPFRRRLAGSAVALLVAAAALWFVPTPYFVTAPGAAFAADRLVRVPGAPHPDHPGRLLLLTVASQRANLFWWLYARAAPDRARLESPADFLGYYPDYEEYRLDTERMMEDSRRFAAAAGLRALGYHVPVRPEGVYVSAVLKDSPARGILRAGDLITAWAGRPVTSAKEIQSALAAYPPGEPVGARVRRGGQELELQVPTAPRRERPGAAIGAVLVDRWQVDLPVAVQITPGPITGPSAGLAFSLEVVAQLAGGEVPGQRTIAATGEVDWEGRVWPIGGARQKVLTAEAAGASLMFVPPENYREAAGAARRLRVVPVRTVAEAIAWLRGQH